MKILVTGGTGLVGSALVKKLRDLGHTVHVLVRKPSNNQHEFFWDYKVQEADDRAFDGIECIIHLAGASIGKRWTPDYRLEIVSSRVDSADFLLEKCKQHHIRLASFISASGINYYGTFTSDQILDEETGILHKDFLSDVCEKWEAAAGRFSAVASKTVIIRTAPVLSQKGGTMEELKKIADLNLAAGIGSGKQWFNWIHLDDLVNMYVAAVVTLEMNSVYNAVADEVPANRAFMKRLADAQGKFFFPVNIPAAVLRIMFGQMSEMILEGTRVSNKKIKSLGFDFKYETLTEAFAALGLARS
ncbi:MAG: TIGR01777 family oxidoreductase [Weeksellaceae bacterium]|nr:TIGR01777 family oxidoreductase [Weeksellaceae bacterium]